MISIEITNIKNFMSHLFIKDTFDNFLCKELSFHLFSSFNFEGSIHKDYFDNEEYESLKDFSYIPWSYLKPACCGIIKANHTPLSLKGVFLLSPQSVSNLLANNELSIDASDINALSLNIRFEGGKLNLVTGTSRSTFTMDKALDDAWDKSLQLFLKKFDIN